MEEKMENKSETKDQEKIKKISAFHGCNTYTHDFFETREYRKLKKRILSKVPTNKSNPLCICDLDDVIKAGKYVIQKHTGETNTEILYSHHDHLYSKIIKKFGTTPKQDDHKAIIKYMKENSNPIDVTDIPIKLTIEKPSNGCVVNLYTYLNQDLDPNFYANIPIVVTRLELLGICSDITKLVYIHEMYHALTQRNKGNIQNMLNMEMLPIFMEHVAAIDLDSTGNLYNKKIIDRLIGIKHLLENLDENFPYQNFENTQGRSYILSTLEATALFETYQKGKAQIKTEIDNDVNRVITGNITLEDLIQKYEATPEQGTKIIKRQIRKLF